MRLELVCHVSSGTHSRSLTDVGIVRVEPKLVELSQTSASVEWGRSVICVESEDRVRERDRQCVSEGGMRRTNTGHAYSTN